MKDNEYEYEDQKLEEPRPRRSQGGKHVKPKEAHARPTRSRASESRSARNRRTEDEEFLAEEERPVRSRSQETRSARADSGEERPARSRTAETTAGGKPKRKKKKKKAGKIVLIVVLALVLLIAIAGLLLFRHFYGLLNGGQGKSTPTPTPSAVTEVTPDPTDEPTPTPEPTLPPPTEEELREMEELKIREELQEDAEDIMQDKNVYNILLLGADGRSEEIERSDAMILASINKETKTIWLTSFMRDTMVTIDGWYQPHLNWATSLGGVDLLIDTIESEKNFAIDIDNWALVNFVDFAEIADMLGPVTVTVDSDEAAQDMNYLVRSVCQMLDKIGKYRSRYYFNHGAGTYTMNDGVQILAYCRERHYGGDTGRSEKQREVLTQLWENAKKLSLKEQYELMEKIMSIIHTDLTMGQCASLLLSAPSYINYEIKTQQCPTPGAFWKGRDDSNLSVYYADFKVNRNFLRATIYNEPMTAQDLTSTWTGAPVLVAEPTA